METIRESTPKARKEHTCDYCGGNIETGEVYNYQFNVDGDAYEWKSHIKCDSLCHDLDMFHDCYDGIDSAYFWESVFEYYKTETGKNRNWEQRFEILDWTIQHLKNKNGKNTKNTSNR